MHAGKNKRRNHLRRRKKKAKCPPKTRKHRNYKYSADGDTLYELGDNNQVIRTVWQREDGPLPERIPFTEDDQ